VNCIYCDAPDAHPGTRRCEDLSACRVREAEAERDEARSEVEQLTAPENHVPGCRKRVYDRQSSPCTCAGEWDRLWFEHQERVRERDDARAEVERLKAERVQDVAVRREQCEALNAAEKATFAAIDRHQVSHARAVDAEAQRDELLAALNEVLCVYDVGETRHDGILGLDWDSSPDTNAAGEAWAKAHTAVAKARGTP
jgi:hypothetical protein